MAKDRLIVSPTQVVQENLPVSLRKYLLAMNMDVLAYAKEHQASPMDAMHRMYEQALKSIERASEAIV